MEQRGMVGARLRGIALLALLGTGLVAATILAGLAVGGGLGPFAEQAGALGVAIIANLVGFLVLFALLTRRPFNLRELLPGAAVAAVGMLILQAAGGWYVDTTITRASETYGTFALVIGLLSWFLLSAHVLLGAAELNVVLCRGMWPRSLAGALTDADRLALRRHARAARQDARQEILVRFDDDGGADPLDGLQGRTEDGRDHTPDREHRP
jgi:uncharacterized BrkB/YihY/UPF0761 family membrane protein